MEPLSMNLIYDPLIYTLEWVGREDIFSFTVFYMARRRSVWGIKLPAASLHFMPTVSPVSFQNWLPLTHISL